MLCNVGEEPGKAGQDQVVCNVGEEPDKAGQDQVVYHQYPHRRLSPPGDYPHRRISLPENIPTGDYPHHKSERSPLRTYVHELRASHNVYVVWK